MPRGIHLIQQMLPGRSRELEPTTDPEECVHVDLVQIHRGEARTFRGGGQALHFWETRTCCKCLRTVGLPAPPEPEPSEREVLVAAWLGGPGGVS